MRSGARRLWPTAVLVAGLVAGCSGGGSQGRTTASSPSRPPSSSASSASVDDGSTQLQQLQDVDVAGAVMRTLGTSADVTVTNDLAADSTKATLRMVGTVDFVANTGRLDVTIPGAAGGNREVRELLTPTTVYLRGGSDVPGLPQDAWGALPRAAAVPHYLLRTAANDVAPYLRQLGEIAPFSDTGPTTVNGVAAEHLRGFPTPATVKKYAGPVVGPQLDRSSSQVLFDAEAWIDKSGRLVRVVFSVIPINMAGPPLSRVQIDLSGFGAEVGSTVPVGERVVALKSISGVLTG